MTVFAVNKELPEALQGLQPAPLWRFFGELSSIPRPSYKEQKVLDWLKVFAEERGLAWSQDAAGNLVVRRPGGGGGEAAPTVIIQGHIDMVTEKNADVQHDFEADGIRLVRRDGWVTADGTTLGADNGIGVCAALAVLDSPPSTPLPPLEALFTVDEEVGMTGALRLDPGLLTGRVMLNLDTEDWGDIFIGCAGGGDSALTLDLPLEPLAGAAGGWGARGFRLGGMLGGHSGLEIGEDRANALRLAARAAAAGLAAAPGVRLLALSGGDKRNAIPREAGFQLAAPDAGALEAATAAVRAAADAFRLEYGALETGLALTEEEVGVEARRAGLTPAAADRLLLLLLTLPHGVIKHSHTVPGLVETSSNLASATIKRRTPESLTVELVTCTRSSLDRALEDVRQGIARLGRAAGAAVHQDAAYPGWVPEPDAPVVHAAAAAIQGVTGKAPAVKAIHAGLECGIIGQKLPGVQSVSYGPTIRGAHSPDERVEVATVAPFYEATLALLRRLAQAA
ncbi:hypothetical protein ACKKBG_A15575 [Auxenochlorella protothecoides x Auxenochlorella symbiontica]